ncbi:MAG: Cytidylate kinase [Alphaproteobacteria bacterium MarineAlpha3_Bin2]|nr:MAG: Cytidylate kinase [Alphaproteobacteria bacterium MarineAlpha3_Bin2]
MIIAIDGPAAAGKGTLAGRLADHFGLAILDTGILYRAVGMKLVREGGDPDDASAAADVARALAPADLDADDLRTDAAADAASRVSAVPAVRQALLEFQRAFAENPPDIASGNANGAILDGRDIGTVVCPNADCKLFITADVEVRAKRRFLELRERGLDAIHGRVLADMKERDARDSDRAVSPLEPAKDALQLDTSEMDADQAFAAALSFITSENK